MPAVGGFLLGAFGGAGIAVPAALSAGVAAGATFAASALGGIALNLLSSVALSALSMALQPTPKAAGLRTETTLRGGHGSRGLLARAQRHGRDDGLPADGA